jgi:putative ABC transport system ATP-binding protein
MDALLSLERVSLHYERGPCRVVPVLREVSLEMWPGEVICVWAQRGRGKTTFLRVAAGMEQPDGGRVVFAGRDLACLSDEQRSRLLATEIGWVAGTKPKLDVPMVAHVAMPLTIGRGTRKAYRRAREALERVGAADCAGQRWGSLANWERALVAVARGIVREPALLLVDDLTVMLGPEETDAVTRLLTELAGERDLGVLASVSDMRETVWSDRIGTLSSGELLMPAGEPKRGRGKVVSFPGGGGPERGLGSGLSA